MSELTVGNQTKDEKIKPENAHMREKITMMDLNKALHDLGARPTRGDIKDMIWEVDDDLDGMISYKEFDTTYRRCIMENS